MTRRSKERNEPSRRNVLDGHGQPSGGTLPSLHPALNPPQLLPDPSLDADWEKLFGLDEVKQRALNHAVLAVRLRRAGVPFATLPIHGLLVFTGPPGVGKTQLARGLPNQLARALGKAVRRPVLVEINPHVLTSDLLGRSQKAVKEILEEELAGLAETDLVVAVVDEVESFAAARSEVSLKANPVDVHRATDAVLDGLDRLARERPNLIIIATTNFPRGVDEAFLSRADAVFTFPLPSRDAVRAIVTDTLDGLRAKFPTMALPTPGEMGELADVLTGLNGRRVRKFVLDALARDVELALEPARLTPSHLLAVARDYRATSGEKS